MNAQVCDFDPGYLRTAESFPFLRSFERAFDVIDQAYEFIVRNEFMVELPGLAERKAVQKGLWLVFPIYVNCNYDFYLDFLSYKMGVDVRAVQSTLKAHLPELFALVDEEVRRSPIINMTFYRMKPNGTLRVHADSGEFQYRAHMGLRVPSGNCGLKVKDTVAKWRPGKFLVFDATQPHMAWNFTSEDRVVFSIDIFKEPLQQSRELHIAETKRRMENSPLGFEGGGYLKLDDRTMRRHNHLIEIAEY